MGSATSGPSKPPAEEIKEIEKNLEGLGHDEKLDVDRVRRVTGRHFDTAKFDKLREHAKSEHITGLQLIQAFHQEKKVITETELQKMCQEKNNLKELDFVMQCDMFRTMFSDADDVKEELITLHVDPPSFALDLVEQFIKEGAPQKLNIPTELTSVLIEAVTKEEMSPTLFDDAETHVARQIANKSPGPTGDIRKHYSRRYDAEKTMIRISLRKSQKGGGPAEVPQALLDKRADEPAFYAASDLKDILELDCHAEECKAFEEFVKAEFAYENIEFFREVGLYMDLFEQPHLDDEGIRAKAAFIVDTFIRPSGEKPVNISGKIQRQTIRNFDKDDPNLITKGLFANARVKVLDLLAKDKYMRFRVKWYKDE